MPWIVLEYIMVTGILSFIMRINSALAYISALFYRIQICGSIESLRKNTKAQSFMLQVLR